MVALWLWLASISQLIESNCFSCRLNLASAGDGNHLVHLLEQLNKQLSLWVEWVERCLVTSMRPYLCLCFIKRREEGGGGGGTHWLCDVLELNRCRSSMEQFFLKATGGGIGKKLWRGIQVILRGWTIFLFQRLEEMDSVPFAGTISNLEQFTVKMSLSIVLFLVLSTWHCTFRTWIFNDVMADIFDSFWRRVLPRSWLFYEPAALMINHLALVAWEVVSIIQ